MAIALGVIFYPLKEIGANLQNGEGFKNVGQIVANSFKETAGGDNGDQTFLDQFAMTVGTRGFHDPSSALVLGYCSKLVWGSL